MFIGGDDATVTRKDLRASGWRIVKGVDKITKKINDVLLNSESDNGYKAQFTNNIALGTKLFTIWGKDVYYGGDMLHNFQSNTNVDIPSAINYIQLGTGATHTIDDFYNYFYKDHDE